MHFAQGIQHAPRLPRVYMIRRSGAADAVYIGSAGEQTAAVARKDRVVEADR